MFAGIPSPWNSTSALGGALCFAAGNDVEVQPYMSFTVTSFAAQATSSFKHSSAVAVSLSLSFWPWPLRL